MSYDPQTGQLINSNPAATGNSQQPVFVIPQSVQAAPPSAPSTISPELRAIFDAELNARLEAVRTEEKNKLYPQIDELKGQLQILSTEREERLQAEAAAQQQAAEAERLRLEAESSSKSKTRTDEVDDSTQNLTHC